jgi:DNA-binding CsgD family transcriptional regulator
MGTVTMIGRGNIRLTRRQRQCLQCVSDGMTSKEIARALSISPSTVDNHLREAIMRMGMNGRVEAARALSCPTDIDPRDTETRPNGLPSSVSLIRVDEFGSFALIVNNK